MGRRELAVAAVVGAFAMCAVARAASAQDLSGRYETLDGRIQHDFQASAVYAAKVFMGNQILSFDGLYQQGENVCLSGIQGDSTGGAGNVLLYVGDNACCLEFRQIADKFAVTKMGVAGDPHGPGFFLCQHQFLKRNSSSDTTLPATPPPSPPRKLHP